MKVCHCYIWQYFYKDRIHIANMPKHHHNLRKLLKNHNFILYPTDFSLYHNIWQIVSSWTSPDGQYQNPIDYILYIWSWRSSLQSTKTRPGADCGSGYELLIAKFRLKLNKVGKTIGPFRYDLNQIPYDYTVGVGNRFKVLYLIDRMPEELWTEVHSIVQKAVIKIMPKRKKCKKAKWLWERKRSKRQRRKGKIYPFECRVPKNSKER